jgi:transposase-like protein
MSVLSKPYFHDEEAAFRFVESIIWSQGPVCPHCGGVERISAIKANPEKRVRYGLKKCGQCKSQFTVRMGTIFEESKLPLFKWLQAIYLMCSSKKGISAKQLERTLEVTYKTAWFLAHRIREAMRSGELAPFGQGGGTVEADEAFLGNDPDMPSPTKHTRIHNKNKVLSLVDRSTGRVRSFVVDRLNSEVVAEILAANIAKEARLVTDEASHYIRAGKTFDGGHEWVRHRSEEYVRGDVYTNTIEGYFSIFKRGMKGVYQHCSKKHLHRYVAEFDFRYSERVALGVDDQERTRRAIASVVGKRLTYRRADSGAEAYA